MLEVVLDTNVLVAAFRSKRGASYQMVRSIGLGDWRPNISVARALEYEDVLKRQALLPSVTEAEIDRFLDYVFQVSNLIPSVQRRRPNLPDPGDELILELAVESRAIIVTHSKAHFTGAARFGILVKTPAEFLKMLRESQ
ncbi:MAG: PIN domain-containing protein [Acidobacteriaceae bacterium]|nr:PIN domain-containing protein [Acidobacteriaceae bacterium]